MVEAFIQGRLLTPPCSNAAAAAVTALLPPRDGRHPGARADGGWRYHPPVGPHGRIPGRLEAHAGGEAPAGQPRALHQPPLAAAGPAGRREGNEAKVSTSHPSVFGDNGVTSSGQSGLAVLVLILPHQRRGAVDLLFRLGAEAAD